MRRPTVANVVILTAVVVAVLIAVALATLGAT